MWLGSRQAARRAALAAGGVRAIRVRLGQRPIYEAVDLVKPEARRPGHGPDAKAPPDEGGRVSPTRIRSKDLVRERVHDDAQVWPAVVTVARPAIPELYQALDFGHPLGKQTPRQAACGSCR